MPEPPYVTWREWSRTWQAWHDHKFGVVRNAETLERLLKDFARLADQVRQLEIQVARLSEQQSAPSKISLRNIWVELKWWLILITGLTATVALAIANLHKDISTSWGVAIINGLFKLATGI